MAYSLVDPQPGPRDETLAWDDAGPGLYPGEALVRVGRHYAAVSVEAEWPDNNGGLVLKACARWCGKDGETVLTGGRHVEVCHNHLFSMHDVSTHPLAELRKEMAMLVLGEPAALMREVPGEDGATAPAAVLALPDEVRLCASLRQAISCAGAVEDGQELAGLL